MEIMKTEIMKLMEEQTKLSVKCKYCNHSNFMPVYIDKSICFWCNREIKNNTKEHFMYKLRKEQRKQ